MDTGEHLQIYDHWSFDISVRSEISDATRHANLLPVSVETLFDSWLFGHAVIVWHSELETWASFARMIPVTFYGNLRHGPRISQQLSHEIIEIGTCVANPRLVEMGIRNLNRPALVKIREETIQWGKLAFMTATSPQMLHNFRDVFEEIGGGIVPFRDLPMLAALTCVCSGHHGTGLQLGPACFARADAESFEEYWQVLERGDLLPQTISCVFGVSNFEMARTVDSELLEDYGSQGALIDHLIERGYYE